MNDKEGCLQERLSFFICAYLMVVLPRQRSILRTVNHHWSKKLNDTILHITNGDVAADLIKESSLTGDVLPWRDVLHDGPVPGDLKLEELSEVRVSFLADAFHLEKTDVEKGFLQREEYLRRISEYDRLILWYEHDLYDQLQLLQVLHWAKGAAPKPGIELVCIDHFGGIEPFYGLGQLQPEDFVSLLDQAKPVTNEVMCLAERVWEAFCASDPQKLTDCLSDDLSALPFLKGAVVRFLDEYPDPEGGLGRTEHSALTILKEGPCEPGKLFKTLHGLETTPFMGDSSFWRLLKELESGRTPLIKTVSGDPFRSLAESGSMDQFRAQVLCLTDEGLAVLNGNADRIKISGIDRWFGGVHMQDGHHVWRWDREALVLRA